MRILFIGDIVGKPGRQVLRDLLPGIRAQYRHDFLILNAENAAGGVGLTPAVADELFSYGADVLTSGNHIWDKAEIVPYLDGDPRIVRPANYPPGVPGRGAATVTAKTGERVTVINLAGRVFSVTNYDCPFRAADEIIDGLGERDKIVFVDIHGEATSEKIALGWYLDGRVSAVVGTHTHVQTADERILPQGTAYLTDAGMTGPTNSVIGMKTGPVVERFLMQLPVRFEVGSGPKVLSGVLIDVDGSTGRALSIQRILQYTDK